MSWLRHFEYYRTAARVMAGVRVRVEHKRRRTLTKASFGEYRTEPLKSVLFAILAK